ncbi:MAG: hypothetical protein KJ725_14390 [Gammaproteobacteria bacterium]|nr:hypothetical protein [Gammaproteobacteria bacterium]
MATIKNEIDKLFKAQRQKLESIRAKIGTVKDELDWVERSPMTIEDAKANADQWIDEQVNRFDPVERVRTFFFRNGLSGEKLFDLKAAPHLHDLQLVTVHNGYGTLPPLRVDATGLMLALFPDIVRQTLHRLLDAAYESIEPGPPLSERPKMIADLEKKLYQLEAEEESVIASAEDAGLDGFYRRANINPAIVLEIENEV